MRLSPLTPSHLIFSRCLYPQNTLSEALPDFMPFWKYHITTETYYGYRHGYLGKFAIHQYVLIIPPLLFPTHKYIRNYLKKTPSFRLPIPGKYLNEKNIQWGYRHLLLLMLSYHAAYTHQIHLVRPFLTLCLFGNITSQQKLTTAIATDTLANLPYTKMY